MRGVIHAALQRPETSKKMPGKMLLSIQHLASSIFFVSIIFLQVQTQVSAQSPPNSQDKGAPITGTRSNDDPMFKDIYRRFQESYRLGPADELAIHVKGQPDYSVGKVKVSPMGTIYHPLLGDVRVAGLTLELLKKQLTIDLSEYLIDPVVHVELLDAQSAKIGVLGEVRNPGIIVMTRPMTILDAISQAGGFADTGKKSSVTVLRQPGDGTMKQIRVNVKNILEGKTSTADNIALQAGDTVIVHGNWKTTASAISSIAGFASFISFIGLGR